MKKQRDEVKRELRFAMICLTLAIIEFIVGGVLMTLSIMDLNLVGAFWSAVILLNGGVMLLNRKLCLARVPTWQWIAETNQRYERL